jgi:hypothetical protein
MADCMSDQAVVLCVVFLCMQVNVSPGLYRPDLPLAEQLHARKLIHDLLVLKGLGPGGHHHQFTAPGLLNLTFHPDSVALGVAACAGGCETAAQCHGKEACMLCRSCRSEWQNGVLQRVMAEHLGECCWCCWCSTTSYC